MTHLPSNSNGSAYRNGSGHLNGDPPGSLSEDSTDRELSSLVSDFRSHFILPDKSRSFAALHERVVAHLESGSNVAVFQIDGWGYDKARAALSRNAPLLREAEQHGSFERHTAQWPSTTSVQMTTLHSGLPVEQHGVLEWVIYEPTLGKIISPLTFSNAREDRRNTLLEEGVLPEDILPSSSFYQALRSAGYGAFSAALPLYLASPYNSVVGAGALPIAFDSFGDGCETAARTIGSQQTPSYCMLYIDDLDKVNHLRTKDSIEHVTTLDQILHTIQTRFVHSAKDSVRDTVVILTSDHGHIRVDQQPTVYLNRAVPDLDDYLIRGRDGEVIPCSGGYRSCFLHVLPERLEELHALLTKVLAGTAEVYRSETLMRIGVFDQENVSPTFLERLGNLTILPYDGSSVYYIGPRGFELMKPSVHGGASAEEMYTPYFELRVAGSQRL